MKVLLVDDEHEFVSTLAERLLMRGIEADDVTSGKDAILKATERSYDVVVLDLKMAGMGGIETMEKIRKIRPEAGFIILTGHGDRQEHEKALSAGARFHLIKPLNIEVLIEKIKLAGAPKEES